MAEYLGATKKRMEKGAIIREMLVERGIAFMRNRTKPILTSWEVRKRMVDELREKTDNFKQRSLRRKLTELDRALTDRQAFALDRAYTAWLILAGKGKSVGLGDRVINSTKMDGGIPLKQQEFELIGRYKDGIAKWDKWSREKLEMLFQAMAPWAENQNLKPDAASIAQIVDLAKKLEKIY